MKNKTKKIPEHIGKKTFTLSDPIFRQRIFVLLNQDEKSYEKFLNKQKVKDVGEKDFELNRFKGISTHLDSADGTRDYIIVLKEFNWSIFHQGTLIHEITHIVFRIFESNNIPFNDQTQEFIAHSIGRIYEDIAHKLLTITYSTKKKKK